MHYSNFDADIVLADEVHLLMTDKRRKYLAQYDKALMFGFTGTAAHRLDNAHVCIEALFGPTIVHVGWDTATEDGLVSPIEVYWQKVELDCNPVEDIDDVVMRKRHGVWRNEDRNHIIADASRELYNKGLQTLILVETVEHALRLKQLLPEFEIVYSENNDNTKFERAGLTDGIPQMTKSRRKKLKSDFESRKLMGVIANSVWATGVSFDSLEVLVRADASSSPTVNIQWSGRVARIFEGKTHGILIDFEDNFDDTLHAKAVKRRNIYKKNGWKQILPSGEAIS
jgi:superfamily II DNA or RNA helicase